MTSTTSTTRARFGATALALAPAMMFAALVSHPFIARLPDATGVASAVEQGTTQWGVVHLLTAVGVILTALAFLAVRVWLRDAGEDRHSAWALPFVLAGSALYALLPALEFAPMAAALTGGDVAGVQSELQPWFIPILASGGLLFAVGIVGFAWAVASCRILNRSLTYLVVTALVVLALSRMVPLGAVQFYVQAIAGLVALWPLAYQLWRAPRLTRASSGRAAAARQAPAVS
ncbi:hypothetical protein SAMN06265360_111105 [Haloechinothrix alba]|uniref:DUF4386 domain-containing protein n=1 Tax=Haloechinothrix alba TaxID=664784 RepID=A0A238XMU0_9PSEU|nr:hypothetical protein [Haloechinothrix alba]SNR59674.1 hypothetical protein SAMN06265360_111105 [Haloechinothrix alba]